MSHSRHDFDGSSLWASTSELEDDLTATLCERGLPARPDSSVPIGWPGSPWMALSGGAGWMALSGDPQDEFAVVGR